MSLYCVYPVNFNIFLTIFPSQVAELKKKQDAQAQLLRQKQKSDEAAKRLQDDIQRIKSQKVRVDVLFSLFTLFCVL